MKLRSNSRSLAISSLFGLLATPLAFARPIDPPTFTITPIDTLGGDECSAFGLNNLGQVTGSSNFDSTVVTRAFVWSNGVITDLGTLGGSYSSARGINDSGVIGGWSQVSVGGEDHTVRWVSNLIDDLPHLGGNVAFGNAINNAGVIVGRSRNAANRQRAALWNTDDSIVDLGTLGGSESEARSLNSLGHVVGYSRTSSNQVHGFLHDGAVMIDLGTLGGTRSDAFGINDAGTIVGSSSDAGGVTRAFRRPVGGALTPLLTLAGNSEARALNESDWIVGLSEVAPGDTRAVLWFRDQIWDLNLLVPGGLGDFASLALASNVNERGQIIGQAGTNDGFVRGYLLTLADLYLVGPASPAAGANNTFTVFGATPGQRSTFVYGFAAGSVGVPNCPGVTVDIRTPQIAGSVVADSFGIAALTTFVPGAASGRTVFLQDVEQSSCKVSNRIEVTFP